MSSAADTSRDVMRNFLDHLGEAIGLIGYATLPLAFLTAFLAPSAHSPDTSASLLITYFSEFGLLCLLIYYKPDDGAPWIWVRFLALLALLLCAAILAWYNGWLETAILLLCLGARMVGYVSGRTPEREFPATDGEALLAFTWLMACTYGVDAAADHRLAIGDIALSERNFVGAVGSLYFGAVLVVRLARLVSSIRADLHRCRQPKFEEPSYNSYGYDLLRRRPAGRSNLER